MTRPDPGQGPSGLDVTSAEAAEWRAIPVSVLCDSGRHEVEPGRDCPHCGENPKCAGCPGAGEE